MQRKLLLIQLAFRSHKTTNTRSSLHNRTAMTSTTDSYNVPQPATLLIKSSLEADLKSTAA